MSPTELSEIAMSHREHMSRHAPAERTTSSALPYWQRMMDEHGRTVLLAAAWIAAIIIVRLV